MTRDVDAVAAVTAWKAPIGNWRITSDAARIVVSATIFGRAVHARFLEVSGMVKIDRCPERSEIDLVIESASIDSGNPRRDRSLRSRVGLDVAQFPAIRFEGTGARVTERNTLALIGTLQVQRKRVPIATEVQLSTLDDCRSAFRADLDITTEALGLRLPGPFGGWLAGSSDIAVEVHAQLDHCAPDAAA